MNEFQKGWVSTVIRTETFLPINNIEPRIKFMEVYLMLLSIDTSVFWMVFGQYILPFYCHVSLQFNLLNFERVALLRFPLVQKKLVELLMAICLMSPGKRGSAHCSWIGNGEVASAINIYITWESLFRRRRIGIYVLHRELHIHTYWILRWI